MSTTVDAVLPRPGALWRAGLLGLAGLAALVVEIAPISLSPYALPAPALVPLVVAAVALRRPEAAMVPVVLALGLTRDLVGDGPPGAGALALVLGSEALRRLSPGLARASFAREWATLGAVLFAMLALEYALVLAALAQPPYVMAVVRQGALSLAVWPLVRLPLGRRPAGERP